MTPDDELDYWLASGDLPTAFAATQDADDDDEPSPNRWAWDISLVVGLIIGLALIWYFSA